MDVGLGGIGIIRSYGVRVVQLVAEGLVALWCELALLLSLRVFNIFSVEELCEAG